MEEIETRRSEWSADLDLELSVVESDAGSSPDGSTPVTPAEVKVSLRKRGVYTALANGVTSSSLPVNAFTWLSRTSRKRRS